ncbi:MAG: ribose 5-phosphate isomerase A [Clostridia bacterium]|nr:MAG: ribose 5-phosphate isomerase A [Clostridia bacterium]
MKTDNPTQCKQEAARYALSLVQEEMIVGLGTGSTTAFFVHYLGEALQQGRLKNITGVPTSERTAQQARELGIPLTTLDDVSKLDLAVDGADEVDPDLNLIKGLGKALLREKMVEIHTHHFWVIVDESKRVQRLGEHVPLPVEIVQFAAQTTVRWLNTLEDCRAELWRQENGAPWVTDNGNFLARCWFPHGISDPERLAATLAARPGVVEHGLFLNMASGVIIAGKEGVQVVEKRS